LIGREEDAAAVRQASGIARPPDHAYWRWRLRQDTPRT
jgi:hypothetical protein